MFACNRKHAEIVAQQFRDKLAAVPPASTAWTIPERDRLMAGLAGWLCAGPPSVDLISEGTDMCATAAFMPARTLSESLYLQMAGRVLRPVYARGHDLRRQRRADWRLSRLVQEACGPAVRSRRELAAARAPARSPRVVADGRRPRRRVVSEDEEREDRKQCPKCWRCTTLRQSVRIAPCVRGETCAAIAQKDGELVEIADTPEEIAKTRRASAVRG